VLILFTIARIIGGAGPGQLVAPAAQAASASSERDLQSAFLQAGKKTGPFA
jgi:hypothetical protein